MSPLKLVFTVVMLAGAYLLVTTLKDDIATRIGIDPGEIKGPSLSDSLRMLVGQPVNLGDSNEAVEDPGRLLSAEFYGLKAETPGMALAGNGVSQIGAVIADYPYRARNQRPAGHRVLDLAPGCSFRPPAEGEHFASVQVATSDRKADIHVLGERQLIEAARAMSARRLLGSDTWDKPGAAAEAPLGMVDVVVTETSAPVYLVLQSRWGMLWNVITAPGVTLAHVALVGGGVAAVNLPGEVPVEAILTGPDCAAAPSRALAPYWALYERTRPGSDREEYEAKAQAWFDAYEPWYRAQFGRGVEDGTIGFWEVSHVLVGPPLAEGQPKLAYRPVEGATVLVTPGDYIITLPEAERQAMLLAKQLDLVRQAAGGDLAALQPAPMQRAAP